MADEMRDRDERNAAHTRTDAAKCVTLGSAKALRLQDAIEDDEVREALGIPRRRKPLGEGGT
jgi:hypothetical protein